MAGSRLSCWNAANHCSGGKSANRLIYGVVGKAHPMTCLNVGFPPIADIPLSTHCGHWTRLRLTGDPRLAVGGSELFVILLPFAETMQRFKRMLKPNGGQAEFVVE